jgi:hypothetical protein
LIHLNISIPDEAIVAFCQRHHIRKLALFGSVLRDDFRPDSDVDVLVEFEPGFPVGFFKFIEIQDALGALLRRTIDLNTPAFLSHIIRQKVMDSAQTLYE